MSLLSTFHLGQIILHLKKNSYNEKSQLKIKPYDRNSLEEHTPHNIEDFLLLKKQKNTIMTTHSV